MGCLPDRFHDHTDRPLLRCRRRSAPDQPDQYVTPGLLEYWGHQCTDLRDQPGEDGGPLLARPRGVSGDRKSTRLNSSHVAISYAVFCLKKKKIKLWQLLSPSYHMYTYF